MQNTTVHRGVGHNRQKVRAARIHWQMNGRSECVSHTMKYYSVLKMKELLTMLHSAQMTLDAIKLSEITAVTKRQTVPDSSYRSLLEQPDSP